MKNANVHILRTAHAPTNARVARSATVLTGEVIPNAVALPSSRRLSTLSRHQFAPPPLPTATPYARHANNRLFYLATSVLGGLLILGVCAAYLIGQASNRTTVVITQPQSPHPIGNATRLPAEPTLVGNMASAMPAQTAINAQAAAIIAAPVTATPGATVAVPAPPVLSAAPISPPAQVQATRGLAAPPSTATTNAPSPAQVAKPAPAPASPNPPLPPQAAAPAAKPATPIATIAKPMVAPTANIIASAPMVQRPPAGGAIPLKTMSREALGLEAMSGTSIVIRDKVNGAPRSYSIGDDIPGLGVLRLIDPNTSTIITAERAVRLTD